jgi:hypothetical protein
VTVLSFVTKREACARNDTIYLAAWISTKLPEQTE